jgi:hypothetical protein
MDVNASNNIDSDDATLTQRKQLKDEPLVLSTPALHARHKNLTKTAKIKEKS